MKKVLLLLALAGSLFADARQSAETVPTQKDINEKQLVINKQQSDINLSQDYVRDNQLKRTLSDQDSRIRKLESKVR